MFLKDEDCAMWVIKWWGKNMRRFHRLLLCRDDGRDDGLCTAKDGDRHRKIF